MLDIDFSGQARKFLKKLVPKHKRQLYEKLDQLTHDPFPHDCRPIINHAPYFRVTAGEYRIIYRVDEAGNLLIVAIIDKRNDGQAYRKLSRLN